MTRQAASVGGVIVMFLITMGLGRAAWVQESPIWNTAFVVSLLGFLVAFVHMLLEHAAENFRDP